MIKPKTGNRKMRRDPIHKNNDKEKKGRTRVSSISPTQSGNDEYTEHRSERTKKLGGDGSVGVEDLKDGDKVEDEDDLGYRREQR